MLLSTTETIANRSITECLGIARGSTVRARNIGRDIFAGLKNIVGGEIEEYTKLQAQSREQAMQRMILDAERLGADAVVNVRSYHFGSDARRFRNVGLWYGGKTVLVMDSSDIVYFI